MNEENVKKIEGAENVLWKGKQVLCWGKSSECLAMILEEELYALEF